MSQSSIAYRLVCLFVFYDSQHPIFCFSQALISLLIALGILTIPAYAGAWYYDSQNSCGMFKDIQLLLIGLVIPIAPIITIYNT
jgi:hypothetical protein